MNAEVVWGEIDLLVYYYWLLQYSPKLLEANLVMLLNGTMTISAVPFFDRIVRVDVRKIMRAIRQQFTKRHNCIVRGALCIRLHSTYVCLGLCVLQSISALPPKTLPQIWHVSIFHVLPTECPPNVTCCKIDGHSICYDKKKYSRTTSGGWCKRAGYGNLLEK